MRNSKVSEKKKKKSCKTCLPWNGIAFGGDIFYFITSYPFLIAQLLMLISGDDRDEILSVPTWCLAVGVTLGLYLTLAQTDANWVANTVNQKKKPVNSTEEENHVIKSEAELPNSYSEDHSSSGDEESHKLRPLAKQATKPKPPSLKGYQKWYFLPFEHSANWLDYFFSPFSIYSVASAGKYTLWPTVGVGIFSTIYPCFCSISTSLTTRKSMAKFNLEAAKGTLQKLDVWMWATIILGEGLGGLAGYAYSLAVTTNYVASLLGLDEDVAFGFSKPALIVGALGGSALTLAVMYCRALYYRVNQTDSSENLPPLNLAQKLKMPAIYTSYCLDSVNSTTLVVLLLTKNTLPRWGQLLLAGGALSGGLLTAKVPTSAAAHCYRLFNARRDELNETIEGTNSDTTAPAGTPGYQAGAASLV